MQKNYQTPTLKLTVTTDEIVRTSTTAVYNDGDHVATFMDSWN